MGWYNNVEKLEENVNAFFYKKIINFELLQICLKHYFEAVKDKDKSGLVASKTESTVSQRNKHELNCEYLEYRTMILQRCINNLENK